MPAAKEHESLRARLAFALARKRIAAIIRQGESGKNPYEAIDSYLAKESLKWFLVKDGVLLRVHSFLIDVERQDTVYFPEQVTVFAAGCLEGLVSPKVKAYVLPHSLKRVGYEVFSGWTKKTKLIYKGTRKECRKIVFERGSFSYPAKDVRPVIYCRDGIFDIRQELDWTDLTADVMEDYFRLDEKALGKNKLQAFLPSAFFEHGRDWIQPSSDGKRIYDIQMGAYWGIAIPEGISIINAPLGLGDDITDIVIPHSVKCIRSEALVCTAKLWYNGTVAEFGRIELEKASFYNFWTFSIGKPRNSHLVFCKDGVYDLAKNKNWEWLTAAINDEVVPVENDEPVPVENDEPVPVENDAVVDSENDSVRS